MAKAMIVLCFIPGALFVTGGASASAPSQIPLREACRFQFSDHQRGWSISESRRAVVCVFRRLAPSQVARALQIADRESHFHADAKNPRSDAEGLFQHLAHYWAGRVRAFGKPGWFPAWPSPSILNARANAIITAEMVLAEGGWSAWA